MQSYGSLFPAIVATNNALSAFSISNVGQNVKTEVDLEAARKENPGFYQRAWHGSRYDFAKFILSMVGEGEGTQVHGWGIYVAKLRDIAENYRKYVSRPREADTFYDGTAYRAMSDEMKESIRLVMEEVRASWKKNPTQYYLDGAIKKQPANKKSTPRQ